MEGTLFRDDKTIALKTKESLKGASSLGIKI
ncbi:hypothetical protein [Clostridium puniceum]|nr:hypothetical protein [Clostridium puniceum]